MGPFCAFRAFAGDGYASRAAVENLDAARVALITGARANMSKYSVT
ncbi:MULTISPECIES: hypothetical protein [Microbacterium]|nr:MULTISPECIES: hypothetical protein [Microbacterium]